MLQSLKLWYALVDSAAKAHLLVRMITLTDSAVAQIKNLQAEKASEGQKLRILVEAGGCSGFE